MDREPQDRPDRGELERFVRSDRTATFFHSAAWLDSLTASFPDFDVFWLTVRDGAEIAGAMPVARISRGPLYYIQALPFGTYGDPLARDPGSREAVFGRFFDLARSPRCISAGAQLFRGGVPAHLPSGASVRTDECRLVSLEGGAEEAWKGASGKRRQLARRAERAGVGVRLLESEEEVRRFHAIYAEESIGWGGVHPYPERLFLELWHRRSEGVLVFGAFLGGELLGGHIDFFYGDMAQAWQVGMTPRAKEYEAGSLCIRMAIEEACGRGMRIFNLGSSGGDPGILFFKESLGGREHRYPVVKMRGPVGRVLRGRGER